MAESELPTHLEVDQQGTGLRAWYSLASQGIEVRQAPTFEEWEMLGAGLFAMDHGRRWWWGDWILLGEQKWGETYAQALEESGYQYVTLANSVSVCGAIPFEIRDPAVSFSTHAILVPLTRADRDIKPWLEYIKENHLAGSDLRKLLKQSVDVPTQAFASKEASHALTGPQDATGLALGQGSAGYRCPNCGFDL